MVRILGARFQIQEIRAAGLAVDVVLAGDEVAVAAVMAHGGRDELLQGFDLLAGLRVVRHGLCCSAHPDLSVEVVEVRRGLVVQRGAAFPQDLAVLERIGNQLARLHGECLVVRDNHCIGHRSRCARVMSRGVGDLSSRGPALLPVPRIHTEHALLGLVDCVLTLHGKRRGRVLHQFVCLPEMLTRLRIEGDDDTG